MLSVLHEMKPKNDFFAGSSDSPVAQMSDQEFLQAKATYFGLMTEIDEQLGRIFD